MVAISNLCTDNNEVEPFKTLQQWDVTQVTQTHIQTHIETLA